MFKFESKRSLRAKLSDCALKVQGRQIEIDVLVELKNFASAIEAMGQAMDDDAEALAAVTHDRNELLFSLEHVTEQRNAASKRADQLLVEVHRLESLVSGLSVTNDDMEARIDAFLAEHHKPVNGRCKRCNQKTPCQAERALRGAE